MEPPVVLWLLNFLMCCVYLIVGVLTFIRVRQEFPPWTLDAKTYWCIMVEFYDRDGGAFFVAFNFMLYLLIRPGV